MALDIAIVFGTRPEYLKLLPFANHLKQENVKYTLYYIQQHTSIQESMDHPTIHVPIHESSKNRLNAIGIGILTNLEIFWKDTRYCNCFRHTP